MNEDSSRKPSRIRKILGFTLKGLAGALLLCVLAIGGALLWLRTESAAQFVSRLATEQLSAQGLELSMGPMGGVLPGSLVLRDVALSDKDGVFFRAAQLHFETRLLSLLKGRLEVADLSLDRPEIIRLPHLPPAQEEVAEEKAPSSGVPALPFGIRIDRAAVTGGLLHAAVLAPDAQSKETFSLELSASASLEGSTLAAMLQLRFLLADGSGLSLNLELDAASGLAGLYAQSEQSPTPEGQNPAGSGEGEDALSLSILMRENEKGLLSLVMNDPSLPPYVLSLAGKGPVRDWKGDLALLLGRDAPVAEAATQPLSAKGRSAEVFALDTQIGLQCRTGSLWKDLLQKPDFTLGAQNELRAGPKAPQALLPLIGERLKAVLALASQEKGFRIDLAADSDNWRIALDDLRIAPPPQDDSPAWTDATGEKRDKGLAVSGKLMGAVNDLPSLMRAVNKEAAPPPLQSLELTGSVAALADAGFSGIEAAGSVTAGGVSAPGLAGAEQESGKEDFSADYKLIARLSGQRADLDLFSLQGLGLTVEAKGKADTATLAVEAEASIDAADHAPWQDLLGRLTGFAAKDAAAPFGGALALNMDLKLLPQESKQEGPMPSEPAQALPFGPVAGNVRLSGVNMRWPTAQLNNIIGPSISASASLASESSGSKVERYIAEVRELKAGILSASGAASLQLAADEAGMEQLEKGNLKASLGAAISDLAPLAASGQGPAPVSGPLKAEASASGTLKALNATISLSSPAISASGAKLRDVALKINADASLTDNLVAAAGDLSFILGQSPGGPLHLDSGWKVDIPGGENGKTAPMTATVNGLRLSGAGVEISGELKAALPAGAFPELQGSVKGAVADWSKLAALSGAPLSGGPTDFTLVLGNQGRGQEASLNLNLASLRMQEKGAPPAFFIRDVKAAAQASGLPDKLDLNLALDTGRGRGGPFMWRSGKGAVKGSDNNGEFSLSLEAMARGEQRRASKRKNAIASAKPNELLALQGAYDLKKMEVLVNTLALQQPRQRVGLELKKPVTVKFDNGLVAQGLDIGFQPQGKLTADADIAPGKLNLKLKLEELTFAFFKLFTPATLPDGKIMAEIDLQSSGGAPKGSMRLVSQASAAQDVSGVEAASAGKSIFELALEGEISSSPAPSAVAGSGVRSLAGLIWLNGTGSLGEAGKQPGSREGRLNFQLPMRAGANGLPLPDAAAPLAVKLDWNGPIESLWQAIPMADRYLSGNAFLDLSVSGSMNAPKLLLTAYMAGGSFHDIPNGVLVSGVNLEARNTPQGDVRALVSAKDKQSGNLAIEANLNGIMGQTGAPPTLAIRGQLDQFSPLRRDDLSILLSGVFGVKGPLNELEVTSDITVTRGELMLSSNMGGSVTTLDTINKRRAGEEEEVEESVSPGPKLDLHVNIPRYFFIRGMGVNSEWEGDLRVTGFTSAPSLRGSLSPVRGAVDLLSRTFAIGEGEITFTGGMDANPALDLTLVNEGPTITAYVKVGGSAKKPKLTLESKPPLPHDEVLSMVLFGKRMSELSRFESIQLANSLRELSGVGGSSLDVLTGVRKSVGLDMLRVGGGGGSAERGTSGQSGEGNLGAPKAADANGESTPTLEAGKYINDSIYVGVEQGMTQESTAVRVEVELYPSVTLQGKSTSESSEIGIGWKKDY